MGVRATESVVAVALFALLLPIAALPWIRWQYAHVGQLRGWSAALAGATLLYATGLIAFTLFPLPSESPRFCTRRSAIDYWQLVPFTSIRDITAASDGTVHGTLRTGEFMQVFLNVVLFLPLGFLLRYRFRQNPVASLLLGLGVSLGIEVTQGSAVYGLFPCPYRVADVDDLMTNTLGTVLGWSLTGPISRILPPPIPTRDPDLDPPGLLRRGCALLGDLLVVFMLRTAAALTIALTQNVRGHPVALEPGREELLIVGCVLLVSLVVPLLRSDRATVGQCAFALGLSRLDHAAPAGRGAVVIRFIVWWFPLLILMAFGLAWLPLAAVLVLGGLARRRGDRRSVLGVASRTRTVTTATLRDAARHPVAAALPR